MERIFKIENERNPNIRREFQNDFTNQQNYN